VQRVLKGRVIVIAVKQRLRIAAFASLVWLVCTGAPAAAQEPSRTPAPAPATQGAPSPAANPVTVPADYVVGPEDVLGIVFWRERDMSADVVVRPDGRISLPLLNDVDVDGLTPDQVRERVTELAKKFIEDPNVTVVVKQINSRKVYITGNVERPGTFPLLRSTSVLQLIALAGGLKEFANANEIVLVRTEGDKQESFTFNYDQLKNRKNLSQNIQLKPGDTIIVP
jgi:polysaccharide biosynthesis/export protein